MRLPEDLKSPVVRSLGLPVLASAASAVSIGFFANKQLATPRRALSGVTSKLVRPPRVFCPCRVGSVTGADADWFNSRRIAQWASAEASERCGGISHASTHE